MDARQVREIYENLRGLLETGQPPALRVLLRARFLEACLAGGERVWSAYGYEVSRELAEESGVADVASLPPREMAALRDVLERCLDRPVPPHGDGASWRRELESACAHGDGNAMGAGGGAPESPPDGTVFVPGVERIRGNDSAHPFLRDLVVGSLVPLRVRADGLSRAHPGAMQMAGPPRGGPDDESLRNVPREAAALRHWSALTTKRVRFEVDMDGAPAYLDGRSCELALTIAAAAAWSELAPFAGVKRIKPGVAMTGVVSGGRVLPVAAKTLAAKVEASFFGPVRILCVPDEQREEARALARSLAADTPGRSLEVRGASNIEDAWNDRDMVDVRRRPNRILPVLLRRLALSRLFVGALVFAVLIPGGLALHEWSITRPVPVAASWEGDKVQVVNKHGRVILTIDDKSLVPPRDSGDPWRKHYGTLLLRPNNVDDPTFDRIGRRLVVWDLDGDGFHEILVMYRMEDGRITKLAAFDRFGHRRWEHDSTMLGVMGYNIDDPTKGILWSFESSADFPRGTTYESMQWVAIYSSGTRVRGSLQIIVPRRTPQGPLSFIDRIDGATGRHLGMLRNEGHVEGVFPCDIDGDGTLEIAISATHNPTGKGLVSFVRGEAMSLPADGPGEGHGVPCLDDVPDMTVPSVLEAGVLTSIRFPLDTWTETRAHARDVASDRGCVSVGVIGSWKKIEGIPEEKQAYRCMLYRLDFPTLRRPVLVSVAPSDAYRAGLHSRFPDLTDAGIAAETDRLAGMTEFLTAEGWKPILRAER